MCSNDTPEAVYQNLLDAGCDSKLLDELHLVQKELDCLDYLIYKIKKLYLND